MRKSFDPLPRTTFKIQLKRNEMPIGGEGIENLLMNMVLENKTKIQKHTFPCLSI